MNDKSGLNAHLSKPKYCPPSTSILTLDIHSSEAPGTATFPSNLKRWPWTLAAEDLLSSDWQLQQLIKTNVQKIIHNHNFIIKAYTSSIIIHRILNNLT